MRLACCALLLVLAPFAGRSSAQPLSLLDVPYVSQSEALCGGAAAAMVLRYWGTQGLTAESFASLVDRSAAGIRTDVLVRELARRGYSAAGVSGDASLVASELSRRRPVIALIEDRPGTYHYVVIVGWHVRGVVFHDPARAPFQAMPLDDFTRRWDATRRWMLVLTPPAATAPAEGPPVAVDETGQPSSCDALIAAGVREAQASRFEAAERQLTAAITCPGSAAYRELAGVRLLQRRWSDVNTLAAAAVAQDRRDAYAWKLLGTARFVTNDTLGALAAWNQAGEPRIDLVRIDGLERTRQRTVERLIDLPVGSMLDSSGLRRARRQLAELPSARLASVSYVPAANGYAEVRASILERPAVPRGRLAFAVMGVSALTMRQVEAGFASLSGGGEILTLGWRFWPQRPRYVLGVRAPAPWGGTWQVSGAWETQPFTAGIFPTRRRVTAELSVSRWSAAHFRWSGAAGIDRWQAGRATGFLGGGARLVSADDRLDVRTEARVWGAESAFGSWQAVAIGRTSSAQRGGALAARLAASAVTDAAPPDLWGAGDTGLARPTLLRAHPLVEDGRFRADRLGRRLLATSIEGQWWTRRGPVRLAPALFVDAGRTSGRHDGSTLWDVDAGVGIRLGTPGFGLLRIDLARGLRDGAAALSLVYEP